MITAQVQPHLGQLNLGAQGEYKRVVFVCSGGMLRSATSAHWASAVLGWNTRNAGTMDVALPQLQATVAAWAEVIYCMENQHADWVAVHFPWAKDKIKVLNIRDMYLYRDDALINKLYDIFAKEVEEESLKHV